MMRAKILPVVALCALTACSEKLDDAKNAVAAAKALVDMGKQAGEAAEAADRAQALAEAEARKNIDEGMDPEVARQQVDMAKAMAGLQALGKAGGGGAAINWRELAKFVPEAIGDFKASGELDGSTASMAGAEFTKVSREYRAGDRRLSLTISDTSAVALMRAPFAMATLINEDTSRGYKKGKRIAGQPAIVEWRKEGGDSTAVLLVGDRYLVDVRVRKAAVEDEAEKLVTQLRLGELAKLTNPPG